MRINAAAAQIRASSLAVGEAAQERRPKRTDEGDERVVSCNVEGVAWVGPTRIVVVSDARKSDQHCRCKDKAQSILVFELYGGATTERRGLHCGGRAVVHGPGARVMYLSPLRS